MRSLSKESRQQVLPEVTENGEEVDGGFQQMQMSDDVQETVRYQGPPKGTAFEAAQFRRDSNSSDVPTKSEGNKFASEDAAINDFIEAATKSMRESADHDPDHNSSTTPTPEKAATLVVMLATTVSPKESS